MLSFQNCSRSETPDNVEMLQESPSLARTNSMPKASGFAQTVADGYLDGGVRTGYPVLYLESSPFREVSSSGCMPGPSNGSPGYGYVFQRSCSDRATGISYVQITGEDAYPVQFELQRNGQMLSAAAAANGVYTFGQNDILVQRWYGLSEEASMCREAQDMPGRCFAADAEYVQFKESPGWTFGVEDGIPVWSKTDVLKNNPELYPGGLFIQSARDQQVGNGITIRAMNKAISVVNFVSRTERASVPVTVFIRQLGRVSSVFGSSSGGESCNAVTTDTAGNIYCAGHTDGDLAEASGGATDAFVMKLDNRGSVQWIRQLGRVSNIFGSSLNHDFCNGVAVDSAGNVYCAGGTSSQLSGGGTGGVFLQPFVMKMDSRGNVLWVKESDGYGSCTGVATDNAGGIYCAGTTTSSLGEKPGGSYDAFVMKLNSGGQLQWIRQLGAVSNKYGSSAGADHGNAVAVDGMGNVYCAGRTNGNLAEKRGGGDSGNDDAFVMKLNSGGVIQWVKQLGSVSNKFGSSTGSDSCNGVAVDSAGSIVCAGHTTGNLAETNGGKNGDAFVMKLSSGGAIQWVKQLGAVSNTFGSSAVHDGCYGVALDATGGIYCAGRTASDLSELNGNSIEGSVKGGIDAFVMKLSSGGVIQWVKQLGRTSNTFGSSSGQETLTGVTVDRSGNLLCSGYTIGDLGESSGGSSDAFIIKMGAGN